MLVRMGDEFGQICYQNTGDHVGYKPRVSEGKADHSVKWAER